MVDYQGIVIKLEEERKECNYRYSGMVPAYYTYAIGRAIEALRECEDCYMDAEESYQRQQSEKRFGR